MLRPLGALHIFHRLQNVGLTQGGLQRAEDLCELFVGQQAMQLHVLADAMKEMRMACCSNDFVYIHDFRREVEGRHR